MKVLSISLDKKILEKDSSNQKRQVEYGRRVDELTILILNKGKEREQRIGNLHIIPANSKSKFLYIFDAVRKTRKIDFDLVTAQDTYDSGFIAWWISLLRKKKIHLQVHIDFFSKYFKKESLHNNIRYYISRFLIPKADRIRVVSERIYNYLVDKGVDRSKIDILPVYTGVDKIKTAGVEIDLLKKYPQFNFIILMASRLVKQKNIGLAIEAMKDIPDIGLIIVGSGPEEKILKEKAREMDNIIFESWTNNLSSYFKTADLFLSTSNYEGWGRTSIEAMAAECPVLMSDVGLAGEIIKDNYNGLVFSVGNKDELVDKIKKIINDKELRDRLVRNAHESLRKLIPKKEYLNKYYTSWQNCFL